VSAHLRKAAVLAVVVGVVSAWPASAPADKLVSSPHAKAFGARMGDWLGVMFKHGLEAAPPDSPLVGNGDLCPIIDGVAISYPQPLATVTCTVPAGTPVTVLLFGSECSTVEPPPFHGGPDLASLLDCAVAFDDSVTRSLGISVDGNEIPDSQQRFRFRSGLVRLSLPADNVLGAPAGPALSGVDGWMVMVKPLAPGEHDVNLDVDVDLSSVGGPSGPLPGTVHIVVTKR
jgi:hypothetical protein